MDCEVKVCGANSSHSPHNGIQDDVDNKSGESLLPRNKHVTSGSQRRQLNTKHSSASSKHQDTSSKHHNNISSSNKSSSNLSRTSSKSVSSTKHKNGLSSTSKHDGLSKRNDQSEIKQMNFLCSAFHKEDDTDFSSSKMKNHVDVINSNSNHSKDNCDHKHFPASSSNKLKPNSKHHDDKTIESCSSRAKSGSNDKSSCNFNLHRHEEKPVGAIKIKVEQDSPPKFVSTSPSKVTTKNNLLPKKEVFLPGTQRQEENAQSTTIDSDDDEKPLSQRRESTAARRVVKRVMESDDDEPLSSRADKAKKVKSETKVTKTNKRKAENDTKPVTSGKQTKKKEEENAVWRWWEEKTHDDGNKWAFLEHKGPIFAPPYEPLPKDIKFYYDGKTMLLRPETEEVATFYAKMLDHDYTTRGVFNENFFRDWRKVMSKEERERLVDLKKCNFTELNEYFKVKSEERKNMSKEEKQLAKKANEDLLNEYGFCIIDGHKEKIGNFKIEPPGLFRGRGDHPKQGMLKHRVVPENVIINCSKDSKIPKAPKGHQWKEVRHDNTVTWLSSWTENIQGSVKYVMLNAASKLKGEKDWQKYETARRLHKCVDRIRTQYRLDWKDKTMLIRQRSVALYFIDKLALRAGNEKEDGETADTVGCCSLRVEHLTLHEELDGNQFVVDFDFLGKDCIRYQNSVAVEKRVFKNLQLFIENKSPDDDLFDRLNTSVLNKYLQELMEGLTAKVFRTYNASHTLQGQLNKLTIAGNLAATKILSYNRANRAVAVLCNHQRAVPKTFAKSMENLNTKIAAKRKDLKQARKDIKDIKADYKATKTAKARTMYEKKKKLQERLEEQLMKLEVSATDKDENKDIALGTSKLNYLDPRISVAWCKKFDIPIEKIYNKTQREKFRWAIDMATADFQF